MRSRCERFLLPISLVSILCGACGREGSQANAPSETAPQMESSAAPTNRLDIPPVVRANLGITFANVERRAVTDVIRAPGRFELLPSARRNHHSPLDGRVELLVRQYQGVEPGTILLRLDSPQWRSMQREIDDTVSAIAVANARLASLEPLLEAHRLHETGLRDAVDLWTTRVAHLEAIFSAGGGQGNELAEARSRLTEAKASFGEVMEKDAELQVRTAEIKSAAHAAASRLDLLLSSAATLLGVRRDEIDQPVEATGVPRWRATNFIEIRAATGGVVESLDIAEGSWVRQGDPLLSVIDPKALRFRATALQGDLPRLRTGQPAEILPTQGWSSDKGGTIPTTIELVPHADPERRTIDLLASARDLPPWAIPGVGGFLEVRVGGAVEPELVIPLASVMRDGLTPVIFRRDPASPDKVIRLEADLGMDDGRWVVIQSGVRVGDEIVLDGAYQLLLASSGSATKGGHFHADGTFHAEDH